MSNEVDKDIELNDAVGLLPPDYRWLRLHAGGAVVVWPGLDAGPK